MASPRYGSSLGSELLASRAPPNVAPSKAAAPTVIDAGLRSQQHYIRALPKWRYEARERLLPLVRWETPYLAALQSAIRTPFLDRYFALTANLGTHTFFMIGLPILFWCGFSAFGKGLVHILAVGVFFSGFVKDFCSLPRPLSPPLQRITMSGSAALEYGFPSTHSTNAVSVAIYAILLLRRESNTFSPTTTLVLEGLSYFYAVSIVVGRLYCGMHGFFDVVIGSLLGVLIGVLEFYYAPVIEEMMNSSGYLAPLTVALIIFVLVRIHPEPADDCPCFDDSVSFAGVMIGVEYGTWRLARSSLATVYNGPDATFALSALGWPTTTARVVFGVLCIFAWRGTMKPTLLRVLPHLFRVIETHGWSLPRRFFVPASEYKDVPLHVRDDNVLPNVSDMSKMVNSIRGPGRGRAVSIGPQSAADAYETLAYRERRRRESLESEGGGVRSKRSLASLREKAAAGSGDTVPYGQDQAASSGVQNGRAVNFEQAGRAGDKSASVPNGTAGEGLGEEMSEKEMFSTLVRPRVRYDVEVVTKLVIYAGIGWLAVDGMLVAFEHVGLGAMVT